jgi:hypothetical protein
MTDLGLVGVVHPSFGHPQPSWWRRGVVVVVAYVINPLFSLCLSAPPSVVALRTLVTI